MVVLEHGSARVLVVPLRQGGDRAAFSPRTKLPGYHGQVAVEDAFDLALQGGRLSRGLRTLSGNGSEVHCEVFGVGDEATLPCRKG